MTENFICIFDVGTTGARTIIFSETGKIVSKAHYEYPITKQPPGVYEQDPKIWIEGIKQTSKTALKNVDKDNILGISACFHRATTTFVDKTGEPLYPAITWQDFRIPESLQQLNDNKALFEFSWKEYQRWAIIKALWIKEAHPEIYERTAKIIQPDSYVYHFLTGEYITDRSNSAYGILDFNTLELSESLSNEVGIEFDKWAEIKENGSTIGELLGNVSDELGLKKGLPIYLGGADQQCSALGVGGISQGDCKTTLGTGAFTDLVLEERIIDKGGLLFTNPHVLPNRWVLEGVLPGTGTLLKWYVENFAMDLFERSKNENVSIYDLIIKEAESVPAGCNGLMIIPLQFDAKGTVYGWSFGHDRASFTRAILESTAYTIAMYSMLIKSVAGDFSELKLDGGGANSPIWAQIIADVIQKPVQLFQVKEGSALGAAILGFLGAGLYKTPEEAISKMAHLTETKTPNKNAKKAYRKLKSTFQVELLKIHEGKRITGKVK
ncbi:MAG: FGGY-family carbohydrate kinase [Candidatus Helarchaeota archaeon]